MPARIPAPFRATSVTGDIRHTVRYTDLLPTRFKNFWPD
jgi:hypothetical protein